MKSKNNFKTKSQRSPSFLTKIFRFIFFHNKVYNEEKNKFLVEKNEYINKKRKKIKKLDGFWGELQAFLFPPDELK